MWVCFFFFYILNLVACGNRIWFVQYSDNCLDLLCSQIEIIFIKTSKNMLLAYFFLKKRYKMELGWLT